MPVEISTSVVGLEAVDAQIAELSSLADRRGARKALKAGAGVLAKAGRTLLKARLKPEGRAWRTGNLLRSSTYKNSGGRARLGALAGFRRGAGQGAEGNISESPRAKNTGNHAHLVDQGTAMRYTKEGKSRGRMPANLFWTETKSQYGRPALEKVVEVLTEEVNRILR